MEGFAVVTIQEEIFLPELHPSTNYSRSFSIHVILSITL